MPYKDPEKHKACNRASIRKHYARRRDEINKRRRELYAANKEKRRQKRREQYAEHAEQEREKSRVRMREEFKKRILHLMFRIAQELTRAGFQVDEPFDATDEEYAWYMVAQRPGTSKRDDTVSIEFTIIEEKVREGEGEGIAFMLDFVEFGGRPLGGFTPYNYTPQLWLTSESEIEERFAMFEQLDLSELSSVVTSTKVS